MSGATSTLCKACGFCCDGTLFDGLILQGEDEERAERVRLPIFADDGKRTLRLPCSSHVGACTIYEDRPSTCRTYQCLLVNRLEQGDLDLESALARIARVRALVDAIRPRLGQPGESLWVRAAALEARPFEWQIENEELMLQIATLREMLARFIDARSRRGRIAG